MMREVSEMHDSVVEAINRQINSELGASYSYLAMSAWCEGQKFTGAARWLRLQSQEEYMHAMKLFDFVLARNAAVDLKPIDQPRQTFASLGDVFEKALSQEQEVSRQIDALYETAFKEKAFAAVAELQWFLTEQVEEEKTGREIVAKFKLIGDDPASILDMDRELGSRSTIATPVKADA
jgi:ferritin